MNQIWSCIVITCPTLSSVKSTEKEIKLLKKKGRISKQLCVLTIEDPAKNIGSGAATLNALLVATEYLSAKQNYMVISADVLLNAHILILHNGRDNIYSCSSKAFISLPVEYTPISNADKLYASGIKNNLEAALQLMDELSLASPPGVWVCSTDMTILHNNNGSLNDWEYTGDVVMFCIPSDISYATGHGVVSIDEKGYVADIKYCASFDQIKNLTQGDEKVPLVSGIVFLKSNVAESLLALHVQSPLDSCTYLGLDSGNEPIQVSLFFDLLIAMCTKINESNFISGQCGKIYNKKFGFGKESSNEIFLARTLVWKELSKYSMSARILVNSEHLYWSSQCCPKYHMSNLFKIASSELVHSSCQIENTSIDSKYLILNSHISTKSCRISSGAIISDSDIEVERLSIGENTFVSNLKFIKSHSILEIPSNLAVLNIYSKQFTGNIIVILGVQEDPFVSVNLNTGTFCNKPWLQFMKFHRITENEIWDTNLSDQKRTLSNAKLFTDSLSLQDILYLFACDNPDIRQYEMLLMRWKENKHYSIDEILENIDYTKVLNHKRNVYDLVSCKIIKNVLCNNEDLYLLPYFYASWAEEWFHSIMNTLDSVLLSDQNTVIKSRTLSNMADLLSAMAGITGGLRSGPGNNRVWEKAFELLLIGQTIAGIKALSQERSHWMDRPDHVMRAARHYERAAQILIQNSVKTVKEFITLNSSTLPDIGMNITFECPARIDLQGGWSDTPPICYELGGSVVNIAVLMDGKKPIGARACRIPEPHIKLKIGIGEMCQDVLITDIKNILNYDQPNAKGALLKAAIICIELIDTKLEATLADQLMSNFGGGFEIQSWSLLHQGCGMGTSSILAGAIVAALWSVSGKKFDKQAVVHAVLCVEQLLTTGGGWQDQVSGVMGGINRGYSDASLPLQVKVKPIILPEDTIKQLNSRLYLIYTGKVRLAKNLLQVKTLTRENLPEDINLKHTYIKNDNVIRNWYAREENIVKCFKDLLINSQEMEKALYEGNFPKIGQLMEKYWEQKKILAPGCEPTVVRELMKILKPLCYGQLLVGAGGGGFMCVLTKEANSMEKLKLALRNHKDYEKLSTHAITIDLTGLEIV